jgi:short-subunit dehydrogenase
MDLNDQLAIVSGASGGIGQAIALALAKCGTKLALVGRDYGRLEAVATKAAELGVVVRFYQVDLANPDEVHGLAKRVLTDFDQVNILVHSVGIISIAAVEIADLRDLESQYVINVRSPYLLTQALLPSLKRQKGQIVFVNSTAGLDARANLSQYGATKHALRAVADSLREEVNPQGVRVLSIFLGRTATPMQAETCKMEGRDYHPELLMQPEDVAAMLVSALSMPRTAEVTEIRMRPLLKSY